MLQKYQFILLLVFVTGLFYSCEKKEQYSAPSLDEDTMIEVLKVLFIAEVKAIDTYELNVQKSQYIKNFVYPELFDSLNIDDSLFFQSYEYYQQKPDEFAALLDKVVVSIESIAVDSFDYVPTKEKTLDQAYEEIHMQEEVQRQKNRYKNRGDH